MTTTLILKFSEKLDCGKCDDVLIQLQDPTLILANEGQTDPTKIFHYIPGTITDFTCIGSHLFQYSIDYDETLLTRILTECDVRRVCCAGCLLQYFNEVIANLDLGGG